MSRPADLVQGTLDLLILKILALEPLHGWADQPTAQAGIRRRPAGERRLAVSRAAQAGTGRMDHRRVAAQREQPPREILFAHAAGPSSAAEGERHAGNVSPMPSRWSFNSRRRDMPFERWRYVLPLRLRSLFRGTAVERELDEELQFHLERQIELNVERGMTRRRCPSCGTARDGRPGAA